MATKFYKTLPCNLNLKDMFNEIMLVTGLNEDELSKELGFKDNKDRMEQLIFEGISMPAYAIRLNRFLKEKGISIRVSQKLSRRQHDQYVLGMHPSNKEW